MSQTTAIRIDLNGKIVHDNIQKFNVLRPEEYIAFKAERPSFYTIITFDQRSLVLNRALYSIYTTIFIIGCLVIGIFFFTDDVNQLVIKPIQHMVMLVQKISENPLGVEYKMLGTDEGFIEGMETTILLSSIIRIGGLIRVGFGEAGELFILFACVCM